MGGLGQPAVESDNVLIRFGPKIQLTTRAGKRKWAFVRANGQDDDATWEPQAPACRRDAGNASGRLIPAYGARKLFSAITLYIKLFMVRQAHHERLNLMALTLERGNQTKPRRYKNAVIPAWMPESSVHGR